MSFQLNHFWKCSVVVLAVTCQSEMVDALAFSTRTTTQDGLNFQPIERMTCDQYRKARRNAMENLESLDRPILIEQALSLDMCDEICHHLVTIAQDESVQVQQKVGDDVFLHDCSLMQAFDLMMNSRPGNSFFAFVEGLLEEQRQKSDSDDNSMFHLVQDPLTRAREAIFQQEDGEFSTDWFNFFPQGAKPTDCVILAGQGATSTFHRDPFEWTGTSLCLEGRKIWRFLKPPKSMRQVDVEDPETLETKAVTMVDTFLNTYRLESIAWDMGVTGIATSTNSHDKGTLSLSAGWQSDFSLYNKLATSLPSARSLSVMKPKDSDELLGELAMCASSLVPNIPSQHGIGDPQIERYSVVQKPGDLLLIPAHWYHQTFAPEPSLAVASQRCSSHLDARRVFRHIISQQPAAVRDEIPEALSKLENEFAQSDPKMMVELLFDFLTKSQISHAETPITLSGAGS